MKEKEYSCADCVMKWCGSGHPNDPRPKDCLGTRIPPEIKAEALAEYERPDNQAVMQEAADVEFTGYGQWCRVREIMEFAKRMGWKKIGIANCGGLLRESTTFAKILESNGFEVYGVSCKAGMVPKVDVGIDSKCEAVGCHICNPILQAKMLHSVGTQLNVVVGLCVGHDSLFYKYSKAVTTTLITKDRVTGNNPAAVLYTADSYYRRKLFGIMSQE